MIEILIGAAIGLLCGWLTTRAIIYVAKRFPIRERDHPARYHHHDLD